MQDIDALPLLAVPTEGAASETLSTAVYNRLRTDIVGGRLLPGHKLRIVELAQRYDSGANPLREALNRLSGEALVVYSEKRGFTVAPISLDDLRDLSRARCMLSEIGLREAIAQGTSEWEEEVLLALHRLGKATREFNPDYPNPSYEQLHRAFHSTLISGCGSQWIVSLSEKLFDYSDRYRNLSRRKTASPRHEEHEALAHAVLARNADEAVRIAREHIQRKADLGSADLEKR
jgi:GntR family transcriptional regulator, carbon starvation induced regulator